MVPVVHPWTDTDFDVTTLAPLSEKQKIDGLMQKTSKRYMHHYNFPSYSVGETNHPEDRDVVKSDMVLLAESALFLFFQAKKSSHMQSVPYPKYLNQTVLHPRVVSVHLHVIDGCRCSD